jgi:hypothetical protein
MSTSPEEIRADIETTRAQLGDTIQELAERADVKARAQEKVVQLSRQHTPYIWFAAVAIVIGAVVLVRRRWSR